MKKSLAETWRADDGEVLISSRGLNEDGEDEFYVAVPFATRDKLSELRDAITDILANPSWLAVGRFDDDAA